MKTYTIQGESKLGSSIETWKVIEDQMTILVGLDFETAESIKDMLVQKSEMFQALTECESTLLNAMNIDSGRNLLSPELLLKKVQEALKTE